MFSSVTWDVFSRILQEDVGFVSRCGKRRIILRKGHLGYNLYFVYSGAVSVVLDQDDGNVFVKPETVTLRKGACFGVRLQAFHKIIAQTDRQTDRQTDSDSTPAK